MMTPLLSMLDESLADLTFVDSSIPVYRLDIFNPASAAYESWTWEGKTGFLPGASKPATCAVRIGPEALSDIFAGKIGRDLLSSGRVEIGGFHHDAMAIASLFVDDGERGFLERLRLAVPPLGKKRLLVEQAERLMAEVTTKDSDLQRVRQMLAMWADHRVDRIVPNQTAFAFFPDLDVPPWMDPQELGIESILRESHADLRREASPFVTGEIKAPHYSQPLENTEEVAAGNPRGWRSWDLIANFDRRSDRFLRHFPATARVLDAVSTRCTVVHAQFLILEGGVVLPIHSDGTHWAVSNLFGVIVPDGNHLTVGGETRSNEEGRSLVFNDCYYHSAANDSEETRVILIIMAMNPRLTPIERVCLEKICRAFPPGTLIESVGREEA